MTITPDLPVILLLIVILCLLFMGAIIILQRYDDKQSDRRETHEHYERIIQIAANSAAKAVAAALNPYNETLMNDDRSESNTRDTEFAIEEPDFGYDPTDVLIPVEMNGIETVVVPRGFDPTPGADNSEAAMNARAIADIGKTDGWQ